MAKNTQYTIKRYVPDGKGGWRNVKDLKPEEYEAFRQKNTAALGEAIKDIFIRNPDFFAHCCKQGYVTDIEYWTDKNTVEEEKTNALTKTKK